MFRAALLGIILLAAAPATKAAEPLILVTTEFPPYMSESRPGGGMLVALTRAALSQSEYRPEVKFMPWARALAEVRSNRAHGLIGAWHSRERESYLAFPEPLLNTEIGFFARRGKMPVFRNLRDLQGMRVGTVRGYANPEDFLAAGLETEEEADDLANLRKLAAGRIDLVLIDRLVAEYLIEERLPKSRALLRWVTPAIVKAPIYTTFAKGAPGCEQRLQALNSGLERIRQSGEFSAILAQHRVSL